MSQNILRGNVAPQGVAVPRGNNQGVTFVNIDGRVGATWYVDYALGSDTNQGGPLSPFKTFPVAYAAASAGDTIFVTGTAYLTETMVCSKNNIAVIGLNSPSMNSRARFSATGTVFTPMVSVTGQGNSFINLATFYGFASATAQVCWAESGGRNYYKNVLFGGGGDATAAAQAGMRSITIDGNGENLFEDCTFGLDTVARATNANATLEFIGGNSQRNKFVRSVFQMFSSLSGNVHIKAAASSFDREQYFFDTIFANATSSTATQITACISCNASAGGAILLAGSLLSFGAGKVSAAGPVYSTGVVPTAATSGIAVASS